MKRWIVPIALVMLVLAACGDSEPRHQVVTEAEVLRVSFDEADDWEVGQYPASSLTITEGRYRIDHNADRNASFTWGTGSSVDTPDVILDLDAEQLSPYDDTLYGVICRLDASNLNDPGGYAFLVSGDGHYGIAALKNRSLSFLVEWHQSDKVRTGQAVNRLRAVCIGDYLALYVNDHFVGDVTDSTYSRAGSVGVIAGVQGGQSVSVAFDNLVIHAGSLADQ